MLIDPETFIAASTETRSYGIVDSGTVEVTIGRETRRISATRTTPTYDAGTEFDIMAFGGMFGRYQTSAKAWSASVTYRKWKNGKIGEFANFGRDDRSGRFNKLNGVFFG